jgi:hypothetical protein
MKIVRKRRTREHIIADLSVNHVERQILLCGHTVERVRADYGFDLFMSNYADNGEIENGIVRLQLKASDMPRWTKDQQHLLLAISRSDLLLWVAEQMPVILVAYDALAEVAYWLYVQRHFEQSGGFNPFATGKTVLLRIPKMNVFDQEAVRKISVFRADIQSQQGAIRHDRGKES